MTTSVSRRLDYIMHNVQDYSVLYNNAVRPVMCEGSHLLTCAKHLHDLIISLR